MTTDHRGSPSPVGHVLPTLRGDFASDSGPRDIEGVTGCAVFDPTVVAERFSGTQTDGNLKLEDLKDQNLMIMVPGIFSLTSSWLFPLSQRVGNLVTTLGWPRVAHGSQPQGPMLQARSN